jgi:hypothetical protein
MDISGTNLQEIAIIIPVVDGNGTIDDAATLRTVSFDGEKFIAGDNNGNIYVSADGASWSGEGSTGTRPLMQPLVFDGTYYYGITATAAFYANTPGTTGTGNLRYSTDLTTWTATTNGNSIIGANAFATIAYNGGTGGAQYQATAYNSSTGNIVTQIAGAGGAQTGWQAGIQGPGFSGGPRLNLFGANRWMIFADDLGSGGGGSGFGYDTRIYSFPVANANTNIGDNLNVNEVYNGPAFQDYYVSAAYGNGIFMATPLRSGGITANAVLTSTDAITWTTSNVASWPTNVNATTSLVYSNNTQTWAMLVRQSPSGLFNGIWVSNNNGNTWSNIAPAGNNTQWWNLAYGSGKFVAVGANGAVFTASGY